MKKIIVFVVLFLIMSTSCFANIIPEYLDNEGKVKALPETLTYLGNGYYSIKGDDGKTYQFATKDEEGVEMYDYLVPINDLPVEIIKNVLVQDYIDRVDNLSDSLNSATNQVVEEIPPHWENPIYEAPKNDGEYYISYKSEYCVGRWAGGWVGPADNLNYVIENYVPVSNVIIEGSKVTFTCVGDHQYTYIYSAPDSYYEQGFSGSESWEGRTVSYSIGRGLGAAGTYAWGYYDFKTNFPYFSNPSYDPSTYTGIVKYTGFGGIIPNPNYDDKLPITSNNLPYDFYDDDSKVPYELPSDYIPTDISLPKLQQGDSYFNVRVLNVKEFVEMFNNYFKGSSQVLPSDQPLDISNIDFLEEEKKEDSWIVKLFKVIAKFLKSLFIPDDIVQNDGTKISYINLQFNTFNEQLNNKIPLISQCQGLCNSFLDAKNIKDSSATPVLEIDVSCFLDGTVEGDHKIVKFIDFTLLSKYRPWLHDIILFCAWFRFIFKLPRRLQALVSGHFYKG